MFHSRICPAIPAAAIAALAIVTPPAGAQIAQIIDQERSISSFAIAPPCAPGSVGDSDSADSFDPFKSMVNSSLVCEDAGGMAMASQDSLIEEMLLASGETYSNAFSSTHMVIHAISSSHFEVTFHVLEPAMFVLTADLEAGGGLPVVLSAADTRLMPADGPLIFEHTVEPLQGGAANSASIAQSGPLAPGQYTFRASCSTVIDAQIEPHGQGDGGASFNVEFNLQRFADLNGDDVVDGADLGQLLLAFGECRADAVCIADLNGDNVVDGADLGILLLNFGQN